MLMLKVLSEVMVTDSPWALCLSKQICFIDGEHTHIRLIILRDKVEQTWFLNSAFYIEHNQAGYNLTVIMKACHFPKQHNMEVKNTSQICHITPSSTPFLMLAANIFKYEQKFRTYLIQKKKKIHTYAQVFTGF